MNKEIDGATENGFYRSYIDYAKALGIFLVVMGHYYSPPVSVFNPYIFHMPLFFFIGGIVFNPQKTFTITTKKVLRHHFLYLIIVYISLGVIAKVATIFTGVKISDGLYLNPIEMISKAYRSNMSESRLFLVSWFLVSYAFVCMSASLLHNILSKLFIKYAELLYITITIVIGVASMNYLPAVYVEQKNQAFNLLCQIGVGLMFYSIGYVSRNLLYKNLNITVSFVLFIIALYLVRSNLLHMNFMVWSKYPDGVIITLIGAMSGIYITLFIAKLLSSMQPSKLLLYVGRNSKTIMSWHLLSFLFIDLTLAYMGFFDFKEYNKGEYHVFNKPSLWGVYMIGGILMPLSFLWASNNLKRVLSNR